MKALRPCCYLLLLLFSTPSFAQTISSLLISPSGSSVTIGGTLQLQVTAAYTDGSSSPIVSGLTWTSTDPRIVQVSSTGLATGIATGIAGIIVSYQGQTGSTLLTSSIGDIGWSAPITITRGGTYSGNWRSTDSGTAAVTVATTDPVFLENSYLMGPADLINDPYWGNNLTVKNVIGIGTNPNVAGQPYGMFVDAQNPILLDVENCYFENVHYGIWVRGYVGNRNGFQTITILNNRARNMLGFESDGQNGWLPSNQNWSWSHGIQLSNVYLTPGIEIAWNEFINYPYRSLVNEVINMFDSGGTSASPALIHDNFIGGAYPSNPQSDTYNGGGFTTDGSAADTVASASAFNYVYNNQIVGTVNMGIEFGAGHDNVAYNNTVISSGLLPDQTKIAAQNVGLTIFDDYGNIQNGTMYNNDMHNNTVGWMCWATRCAWDGWRNDDYFPDNAGDYGANTSLSTDPIPLSAEARQYQLWQAKLLANQISVGSTHASQGGNLTKPVTSISPGAWYTVANAHSSLCLENSANILGQNTCANQQWQFQPTSSGYYQVVNENLVWSLGPQSQINLAAYRGATSQQWKPIALENGAFTFLSRSTAECLDVPGSSSAPLVHLQPYPCNGTGAQSFLLEEK